MAKYNGSVELISGLKQANNQDFPLVDASAVQVNDNGDRLDEVLNEKLNKSEIGNYSSASVSTTTPVSDNTQIWISPEDEENFSVPEIKDDTVNSTDTWSSRKIDQELSSLKSNIDSNTANIKNNKISVDTNLKISGNAADAKVTGDAISSLKEDLSDLQAEIEGGGGGLTADLKAALDQLAQKVAYIDEDGQDYYDALHNALYPPANLVRISCVYMQSSTVYDTDSLDDLKSDLVVTAHFSDSTTQTVTTYTLSGTLTEGTSTVTISYGGKTTKFNVTVTHNTQEWVDGVPYSFEWVENKYIANKAPGDEVPYSGWNASPFLNCSGAGHINIHNGFSVSSGYNAWYDENQTWIDKFSVALGDSSIAVPSNAVYFRVSYNASGASGDRTYTITPMEA